MPGLARRASTHRSSPTGSGANPTCSPNVCNRSDKVKALPPPPPGMPRRPQADSISMTICERWKTETPETRARHSDIKEVGHQLTYPGYRFQHMKKADRDRLRAEKQAKRERECATRKPQARTRASATQEPPPLYTTEARFGPAVDQFLTPLPTPPGAPETQLNDQFDALWLEKLGPFPTMSHITSSQVAANPTVPIDDPEGFNLGDIDFGGLFDGSREIEVLFGANMLSFSDIHQLKAFTVS
ncbi:hypothetical protein JB92DRAFT_3126306 [Gautieria morchelliformis]|nr:hypothetical protein JB92DRAFT_3126306 [Gautieria morchelliformis]